MRRPIEYLEWIRGRPAAAEYDLGASDLVRPDPLPRFGDAPDPDPTLEELLADVYGVDPAEVLVTAGATHANYLAMAAARDDGDRVLVERPGYEPLVATPASIGHAVDRFERPPGEDYRLDPDRVADALGPEAGLVVVTDRHNPSGRRADGDALAGTAAAAREADARLLVDEVYAPYAAIACDGPFGAPSAAGFEGVAVTGSLTKFWGLGTLRLGWLIADPPFVERAARIMDHNPAVAPVSRSLAARALADRDALADRARERIATNAPRLAEFVADRGDLTGTVRPGCTLAFLRHDADGDAVAAAADEEGVLVIPGRFFDDPGRFRISVARDPGTVEGGLAALGRALDGL
ncbi:MAG: pyridoxal phosphate-dependent aminotransferase [Halobacteriales archaeon]